MTIDEATNAVRKAVRDIRVHGTEAQANNLEAAVQLLLREAGETARCAALSQAAHVIEAMK